jgi:hypothetical protein
MISDVRMTYQEKALYPGIDALDLVPASHPTQAASPALALGDPAGYWT